ncbi:MAG: DUF2877 domain-containing protein, partial [Nitriliruptor sp.]
MIASAARLRADGPVRAATPRAATPRAATPRRATPRRATPRPTTPRPATSVAASVAIRDVLLGPPRPARVVAAFPAAVYLAHDDGVVALVTTDGIRHPNALVLPDPTARGALGAHRVHQPGTVGNGEVVVAGHRVSVARWFDPTPRLPTTDRRQLRAALELGRRHLERVTGPLPTGLTEGAAEVAGALADGDVEDAVAAARGLVGLGPGLTPAGDDVLAGLLSATLLLSLAVDGAGAGSADALLGRLPDTTRSAGTAIAAHARGATTSISAALLAHGARGEVAAPAATVLHALTGRGSLPRAIDVLLSV